MDRVIIFGEYEYGRDYKNGWEIVVGNEYKLNDKFILIGSLNYVNIGVKIVLYNDIEYVLNFFILGGGIRY